MYQEELSDKRVLLVFDNVVRHEQFLPLLPPTGCLLLLTSTEPLSPSGLYSLKVGGLTPEDASSFLLALAPRLAIAPLNWLNCAGIYP